MAPRGPLAVSWNKSEEAGAISEWAPDSAWVVEQLETAAMFAQFPVDVRGEMGAPFPVLRVPEDVGEWYRGLQGEPAERLALAVHLEGLLRSPLPAKRTPNPRRPSSPKAPRVDPEALRAADVTTPQDELLRLASHQSPRIRALVASNPATPASALDLLVRSDFEKIARGQAVIDVAVAGNPSASLETLSMLAKNGYWAAVQNNPSMFLHRMTSPMSTTEIDRTIAANTKDVDVLKSFATFTSTDVVKAVAKNPSTPPDVLEDIAIFYKDSGPYVVAAVAENVSASPSTLEMIFGEYYFADDVTQNTGKMTAVENIAKNPSSPTDIVDILATCNSLYLRSLSIRNPNVSAKILEKLVNDPSESIRLTISMNKSSPQYILRNLAKDKHVGVVRNVALNRNTPQDTLDELTKHPDAQVREYVASNTSTAPQTLETLSKNVSFRVRRTVALNASTPGDALERMIKSGDELIFVALSKNLNMPPSGLERLANFVVANRIDDGVHKPIDLLKKHAVAKSRATIGVNVSKNPNTPVHVLQELASSDEPSKAVRDTARATLAMIESGQLVPTPQYEPEEL